MIKPFLPKLILFAVGFVVIAVGITMWRLMPRFSNTDAVTAVKCSDDAPKCAEKFSKLIGFHVLLPAHIPDGMIFDPETNYFIRPERGYDGTIFSPYVQYGVAVSDIAIAVYQSHGVSDYLDIDYKKDSARIREVKLNDGTLSQLWSPIASRSLYFEKNGIFVHINGSTLPPSSALSRVEQAIIALANSLQ